MKKLDIGAVEAAAEEFIAISRSPFLATRRHFDRSEKLMKEWFSQHPEASVYRTKVGIVVMEAGSRLMLDHDAIKVRLGDEFEKFRTRTRTISLSIEDLPAEAPRASAPSTLRSNR